MSVLIGVFIGGMLLGSAMTLLIQPILSYGKLEDEDFPLKRRATDQLDPLTDEEIAELRGLREGETDNANRS